MKTIKPRAKRDKTKKLTVAHQRGLTGAQVAAMVAVSEGADVFSYETASRLREVERFHPQYIDICKAMGKYDPRAQLPYFGAILTAQGRAAVGITDVVQRAAVKRRARA